VRSLLSLLWSCQCWWCYCRSCKGRNPHRRTSWKL